MELALHNSNTTVTQCCSIEKALLKNPSAQIPSINPKEADVRGRNPPIEKAFIFATVMRLEFIRTLGT
jgi:hypothetical protein